VRNELIVVGVPHAQQSVRNDCVAGQPFADAITKQQEASVTAQHRYRTISLDNM